MRPPAKPRRNLEIVRLRHEEGLGYGAIARRFGISPTRVRQLVRYYERLQARAQPLGRGFRP